MNTETGLAESQNKGVARKKEITDISSMLLPLQDRNLVLPGVSVAEIVTFVPPEQESGYEDVPAWFLGNIFWRSQRVPMVSYEMLMGGASPQIRGHCRIAVMNNTGLNQQLNFFAIVLQSTPRLLRLTQEEILENPDKPLEPGEKAHVYVSGEEAVIPDISYIEQTIIDLLGLS